VNARHQVSLLTADGVLDEWDRGELQLSGSLRAMPNSRLAAGREPRRRPWQSRIDNLYTSWRVGYRALKELRSGRYDVLHFVDSDLLVLYALTVRGVQGGKLLFNINTADLFDSSIAQRPLSRVKAKLQRFAVARLCARCVPIVHSETVLASLSRLGCAENAVLIPWGIDSPAVARPRAEVRLRLDLPVEGDILLFAGKVRADKGWDVLADALVHLKPTLILVVAGHISDEDKQVFLRRIPDGWRDRVILRGQYVAENEFLDYFRAADAAVLPYKKAFTGDSGILAIAASQQCPVIATDIGEVGRKVRMDGSGMLVRPEDPVALASGIEAFLALSPGDRAGLVALPLAGCGQFSWADVARRHVEAYCAH
jgi:glycosyltransferase involved in cell wall biosynthesis